MTTTYIQLFRCWCYLATEKRKEAQEQITVTDFFLHLILLNIVFVWEIFLFDACLYVFCNLVIN